MKGPLITFGKVVRDNCGWECDFFFRGADVSGSFQKENDATHYQCAPDTSTPFGDWLDAVHHIREADYSSVKEAKECMRELAKEFLAAGAPRIIQCQKCEGYKMILIANAPKEKFKLCPDCNGCGYHLGVALD